MAKQKAAFEHVDECPFCHKKDRPTLLDTIPKNFQTSRRVMLQCDSCGTIYYRPVSHFKDTNA